LDAWGVSVETRWLDMVGETDFGIISAGGTEGLLGSGQLRHYGWVVLDYPGARLIPD